MVPEREVEGNKRVAGAEASIRSGAGTLPYFIVGMTNSAPARIPVGQREVMVFSLV